MNIAAGLCCVTLSLYCGGGGDIRHYLPSDKCNYNAGTNPRPAELPIVPVTCDPLVAWSRMNNCSSVELVHP